MAESRHLVPVLRTLENERFRRLVLVLVCVPLLVGWFVQTVVQPILQPADYNPGDFHVYLGAAAALAHGQDPYQSFLRSHVSDPAFNRGYIYPPLLAWVLQPLAGLQGLGLDIAQMVVLQLLLLAAVWIVIRALRVRSWELRLLILTLAVSWYPVRFDLGGQVNLLLLALIAVWLAAYVAGDRWWGGVALGVTIAIKLMTAPLLLLYGWGRRWIATAAALLTVAVLWAIPVPQYLFEYFTKVAPVVGAGSGFRENQTPTALISRLIELSSFYGQAHPMSLLVRGLGYAVAAIVVVVSVWALGRVPKDDRTGRALEAAVALSAIPLCVSIQTPSQYVTVFIAIAILVTVGVQRRDSRVLLLTAVAYILSGPGHQGFLYAIGVGIYDIHLLEPWAELSGVVPLLLFWLAALDALRRRLNLAPAESRPQRAGASGQLQQPAPA